MNRILQNVALVAGCLFFAASASAAAPTLKPHHQSIKDCAVCHTAENAVAGNAFVVPSDKACMSCHGSYKDLAKKTANLGEPNPHASHHYGEGISCTACHKEHQPSKVYCNECHNFKYQIK
ncbi:cytochrome c3 family protein [Sutterella sp.]|uniref:cytochrome c3 family protein n=1 Tax=Sutterella sp. TaxID=1981025 RepID=UPI003FD84338